MCRNLRNMYSVEVVTAISAPKEIEEKCPPVIDSTQEFETLCPINKATGHRQNPLDALQLVLSPDKARLVQHVLAEIPSSGVPSDVGTFEFIADRLSLGTDAERALYLKRLESNADLLYNIRPDINKDKNIIMFDSDNNETKES